MRYYSLTLALLISTLTSISHPHFAYALSNNAKVTLVVVDEDAKPLEGVDAGVGFEWATETKAQRGLTDVNGRFTASGNCNGHIGYGGKKDGYYQSHYEYDFNERDSFGWKPWNHELKVVMRKIENPVPMYARKIETNVPLSDIKVGFDLIMGDWVVPYGQGIYSDFTVLLNKEIKSINEMKSSLLIEFNNKHDGIILTKENRTYGSDYKLMRQAPEIGYENNLLLTVHRLPRQWFNESYAKEDNYYIRVRCEENNNKPTKCMYGKIVGPIRYAPLRSKTAALDFKYYVNPDGTRNLEFDPKRNLFKNISDLERVNYP